MCMFALPMADVYTWRSKSARALTQSRLFLIYSKFGSRKYLGRTSVRVLGTVRLPTFFAFIWIGLILGSHSQTKPMKNRLSDFLSWVSPDWSDFHFRKWRKLASNKLTESAYRSRSAISRDYRRESVLHKYGRCKLQIAFINIPLTLSVIMDA